MKTFNSEKTILAIIKFGAVIPTLIFSFLITYTIIKQKDETFNKKIETIKSEFINKEKLHIKNEIDITWKIKNFKSKKSPANAGTASVKIADGKDFNITNINDVYVLEGIIREAQNAIRTAPDFGAFGVG